MVDSKQFRYEVGGLKYERKLDKQFRYEVTRFEV